MYVDLPDKLYYKIGEVAKAFGVNTSLLRFWEKEFKQLKPKKNKKGNRLYTKDDIKILQEIYYLVKEKSYTLDGAKKKLRENRYLHKSEVPANQEVIFKLQKIKDELQKIKAQL
jgi:DNA-binding transcriptional MerR regulator